MDKQRFMKKLNLMDEGDSFEFKAQTLECMVELHGNYYLHLGNQCEAMIVFNYVDSGFGHSVRFFDDDDNMILSMCFDIV